jgi:DNA polymerase III subunit beta
MQFTLVNTPSLRSELTFLKGATETKQTNPVLGNFCFDFLDNSLVKVLSTDLDISASTVLELKQVVKKESGLINAKKLLELLTDLPNNAECTITQLETGWIELKSGKSKYKITGQAREDFPAIEKFDLSTPIELPALKFSALINNTIIGIASEESQRFALNGSQLRIEDNKLSMITTDGHRLAFSSVPFSRPSNSETIKLLIPKKTLQ